MLFKLFNATRANLLFIITAVILYLGWNRRDDNYISAETGIGYLLGIIGGSLMVILLLYPLSKRVSLLTKLLPIRYWFGIHMLFGIIGPVLILFHSNFQLGSTNSTVALTSMLLVAGSGLIGRYIYTHIHHGLYGARKTLRELKQKTEHNHAELIAMYSDDDSLNKRLLSMEEKALRPYSGLLSSIMHVIHLSFSSRRFKRAYIRLLNTHHGKHDNDGDAVDKKAIIRSFEHYTHALNQTAQFALFERLFSLWHILHLPLFIMMIITAVIHIFAVHMY